MDDEITLNLQLAEELKKGEIYDTMNANIMADNAVKEQAMNAMRPAEQNNAVAQRSYSSLSKDEKDKEKEKYKEIRDRNTFVKSADLQTPYMQNVLASTVKIDGEELTQQALYERVKAGDCSNMQQLDPVLRNRAATEYMTHNPINGTPEEFVESLKEKRYPMEEMMNPLLRMGISLVIHSKDVQPSVVERYKKIDELLNKEIMKATIAKPKRMVHEEQGSITREDIERNVHSQVFIMKTLFSAHIGKLRMVQNDKNLPSKKWPGSVANAFTHCSRVMFTMPGDDSAAWTETTENRMMNSFIGKAGFKKRGGATHNLGLKARESEVGSEEKKSFTPFNQYGMNVAVGGLGSAGIPKAGRHRKLKNDGSCGHLYMHYEKGDKEKHSGMLIGFESDAYGVMNQTGHVHDLKATGEFASSFGGQRCDEIGDKYGGRVVDLSGVDPDGYTEVMKLLDVVATKLLESPNDDYDRAQRDLLELENLADQLCGDLMDEDQLKGFIAHLIELSGVDTNSAEAAEAMYYSMYRY